MRWKERQNQVEADVYDVIDELSEELNIKVPYYPEVWWLGNTVKFRDLCLPRYLKREFKIRKKSGVSYYIIVERMVMISKGASRHSILEESAHAFHFIVSGISYRNKDVYNVECLACLVEMIGFLGARLAGSELENPYEDFPDLAYLSKESHIKVHEKLIQIFGPNFDFDDFFVHQQGYGLADRIYAKYLNGEISIDRIRRMFLSKLLAPNSALYKYMKLKKEFWPRIMTQVT